MDVLGMQLYSLLYKGSEVSQGTHDAVIDTMFFFMKHPDAIGVHSDSLKVKDFSIVGKASYEYEFRTRMVPAEDATERNGGYEKDNGDEIAYTIVSPAKPERVAIDFYVNGELEREDVTMRGRNGKWMTQDEILDAGADAYVEYLSDNGE